MNFKFDEAIEILERTPNMLSAFLTGISAQWTNSNEGQDTWNVKEVILHLIEGEQSNWIPRLQFIIKEGDKKAFPAFDRFAHLHNKSTTVEQVLIFLKRLRQENIKILKELISSEELLEQTGYHPAFGTVKVRELISTWAVHDLTHITQIARIMAERYRLDVGPWIEYLGVLNTDK
ncbi:DinB family protein [Cytobacillus gottheilii]|uniref:DinB family protein n=1 Tax=Cytobacillus gottheilii TaxID=859144 RepID=UPI0024945B21|nr:DinB family protein [Cytobacillus gottheilii]